MIGVTRRAALTAIAAAATTGYCSASAGEEGADVAVAGGRLYGSLRFPAGSPPFPAALIIAGSGPTDRDGNSAPAVKSDAYRLLAEALGARGIASLRYDKRGVGASAGAAGRETDVRFDTFVDDAVAWLAKLSADKRISRSYIAGHSEGSLIGMLAARKVAGVAGYVSLCGAGRPAGPLLLDQLKAGLPPALYAQAASIVAHLQRGELVADVPPELSGPLFRPSIQPYIISWFALDPAVEIAKLKMPIGIVGGTADAQVAVSEARLLSAAAPAARLTIVEGMSHMLKHVDGAGREAQLRTYTDPTLPVEPSMVAAIENVVRAKA
ncbi:MAG: alpha/beta hydrolase [Candidatus Eremiobacteraeota bacterium]|nr:alpha/beta hydrolase [Candidatus Eremiobacteraeota bacterium]